MKPQAQHPGAALAARLYDRRITVVALARAIGVTRKTVSAIIHGRQRLTPEIGIWIAKALGDAPTTWIDKQTAYDVATIDAGRVQRIKEAA